MDRKEMIKTLSEFLQTTPKYLGVPSFAYEIEAEAETYTIDRQGTITTSEGKVITLDEILHPQEPAVVSEAEAQSLPIDGCELKLPMEGHTGVTLQNLVNMLFSKQHLIMKAFETETPFMDDAFAADLDAKETGSRADLKSALDELGPQRCPGLGFDFEQGTLTLKLEAEGLTPEKIAAFQDLAALMNENAKKQKRASFKQAQDDNPKYALRTWLIRLGMNGSEYKTTRKTLMDNLEGSGAFRRVGEKDNG